MAYINEYHFSFFNFVFMCVLSASISVCMLCMADVHRVQKRALNSLKPEWQVKVGARN